MNQLVNSKISTKSNSLAKIESDVGEKSQRKLQARVNKKKEKVDYAAEL